MKKTQILKYANDLKSFSLATFKLNEAKLFFKLLKITQDNLNDLIRSKDKVLSFKYADLRTILKKNDNNKELKELIKSTIVKSMQVVFSYKNKNETIYFNMWKFRDVQDSELLFCKVDEDFLKVLGDFKEYYSSIDLKHIANFKSKYTISIYKKIRELYNKKIFLIDVDNLKELLGLKPKTRGNNINTILEKSFLELNKCFNNLKMVKIKNGKNISAINLTGTN